MSLTVTLGTAKTLEANGASIANNAIGTANDANYGIVADGSNFPHARFVLSAAFSVAPTEGTTLVLMAQPLNILSTNNAEACEATRGLAIGSFIVNNVTTTQYMMCTALDVPWQATYYILNGQTGQTVSAGWTLTVTPFTYDWV